MDERPNLPTSRSISSLQNNLARGEPAILASYGLIGAILLLGGAGYLVDRWVGTSPWFLIGGLLIGLGIGFYWIARILWRPRG